jgi:hypothetical protein
MRRRMGQEDEELQRDAKLQRCKTYLITKEVVSDVNLSRVLCT